MTKPKSAKFHEGEQVVVFDRRTNTQLVCMIKSLINPIGCDVKVFTYINAKYVKCPIHGMARIDRTMQIRKMP